MRSPDIGNEDSEATDIINQINDADTITLNNISNNKYVGLPITHTKPDNVFRVQGANPNGFNTAMKCDQFREHCMEMDRYQIDVSCLYEINVDTTKSYIKKLFHDTARSIFRNKSRIQLGSSPVPSKNSYKPGGTMICTRGNTTGRVTRGGNDYLGRWSYQYLARKNNTCLVIISAYRVCKQTIRTNTKIKTLTVTAQQQSVLEAEKRYISPRKAFVLDLIEFISTLHEEKHSVLLIGDFNETLYCFKQMQNLASKTGLVDVMWQECRTDEFSTCITGTERIDYVLADTDVADSVINACYEPYKLRNNSDHRTILLDFDIHKLFGNPTYNIRTPMTREFSSKDRKANRLYIEARHKYLVDHNYLERFQSLRQQWNPNEAEKLDRDHLRACVHAAKTVTKKPNIVYVKKLANLRLEKNVLMKVTSSYRRQCSFDSQIAYSLQEGSSFTIPTDEDQCKQRLKEVQHQIRQMQKEAQARRKIEIENEFDLAAAKGDKTAAKKLKRKIKAEETKMMYKKIANCRRNQKNNLTSIQVPLDPHEPASNDCTQWVNIDAPDTIQHKLKQRNQTHFGQAHGTYPTIPPFSEKVNWEANTYTSELILEGVYDDTDMSEYTKDMLHHMKKKTQMSGITDTITSTEWIGKINKWKESTSTSPSGFHLTHSKALVSPHDVPPESEADFQLLESKRLDLITWNVDLINIAIRNEYLYDRWKVIVNIMILKDPNDFRIHRLRVIHLYEHDYTLLVALKWRQLIRYASNHSLLNDSQYGGVPGRDSVMPTIIEELQYEISRASKRPLVHKDYDATACYDRIIMNLGGLNARSYGMHKNIVIINGKTLKEAKYLLRTVLDISEEHYSHCDLFPIYGSGQGAGNSAGLWGCISCTAFDCYNKHAHGATFSSPDLSVTCKIYMIGFVDDTSSSTNDFDSPVLLPISHYAALAEKDAQVWNDVLHLTGAALNKTKCSYHYLYFIFAMSGLATAKGGTFNPTLHIHFNTDTDKRPLKQLSAYSSHEILGVWKAPAGRELNSIKKLRRINATHVKNVTNSPFNRQDSWTYYHSMYIPSITYPFPSSSFPPKTLDHCQKQIKKAVLPKCGFNRNTPSAIVYSSYDFAGIDMRDLSMEKGLSQLMYLIMALRTPGVPQQLSLIAMSWAQFLAGVSYPIMMRPSVPLPHLEPMKWIPEIRTFLGKHDLQLELEKSFVPKPQRVNDSFLMDDAIVSSWKVGEIKRINACRLFLGVTLVSDIASIDGTTIDLNYRSNIPSISHKGQLPYQACPSTTTWCLWNRFLNKLITDNILTVPLGQWIVSGPDLHRKWPMLYSVDSGLIYDRINTTYNILQITNGVLLHTGDVSNLPSLAIPCELNETTMTIHTSGRYTQNTIYTVPSVFQVYLQDQPPWESELLRNLKIHCDVFQLAQSFSESVEILGATDGSAPQFIGTFGWVLKNIDGTIIAECNGPAPGYRTSSFRTELYGLLSFLLFLQHTCVYTYCSYPETLKIYTDSKSALTKITDMMTWSKYFSSATISPDWDILQAIIRLLKYFPTTPNIQFIPSHQDKKKHYQDLSPPAQANVDADHRAGTYQYTDQSSTHALIIKGTTVLLHSKNGTITSHYKRKLRKLIQHPITRRYISEKAGWNNEFELIDWPSHTISLRKQFEKKNFICKYVHHWLPIGSLVSRYAPHYTGNCPSCPCLVEDRWHLLQCHARKELRKTFLATIRATLQHYPTHPFLKILLLRVLHLLLCRRPMILPLPTDPVSEEVIRTQEKVGWDQLLLGRFVLSWATCQQEFIRELPENEIPKGYSGSVWVAAVSTDIFDFVHKVWLERNQDKHGKDSHEKEIRLLERATLQTKVLYSFRNDVLPRHHSLFYDNFNEHVDKESSSAGMLQWVYTWGPVIRSSVQSAATLGVTRMRSIHSYFLRPSTS